MQMFSVKNNKLLRKPILLFNKNILIDLIYKIINYTVDIFDEKGKCLLNLDDGRKINCKEWFNWEWTQGIALYAIYKFYKVTNDSYLLSIIDKWFNFHLLKELPTKNINTVCPILTLSYRYEDTHNTGLLPILENWSNWLIYDLPKTKLKGFQHLVYHKENSQEIWDDTLMMSILPLVKMGLILKRQSFIDEAIYQILLHNKYLMNIKSGLWFHGWNFNKLTNLSSVEWGRGNSWVTIAIPEIIELIHSHRYNSQIKFFIEILNLQIDSLKKHQDKTGLWHTILNDYDSYLEVSCSAGFAYGILKSINKRYIDSKYFYIAEKAIKGILNYITPYGEVTQVSGGTEVGNNKEYYLNIPLTSMPYGQGMVILALTEYIKAYY